MGKVKRQKKMPSPAWVELQAKLRFPEQELYEIARPCLLDEQPILARAQEVGKDPKTVRQAVRQFVQFGLPGLIPTTGHRVDDARLLPLAIRQHILALKAEYAALSAHEIATISDLKFARGVDHRTVQHVLNTEPLPTIKGWRFPRYQDEEETDQRRHNIIQLHIEGWTVKSIAGYLGISTRTIHRTLNRWAIEGVWGLEDKPHARKAPRKVTLALQNQIRHLQENPALGEYRMHAALKQQFGIDLNPRTCGRIMALNRALYGLEKPIPAEHLPRPMPFEAHRPHAIWSVDLRYIEQHQCQDHTGYAYAISIWDNYSRDLLSSGLFRSQDLTSYLVVLHDALVQFGVPDMLVSDSGGIFLAKQAHHIYATLGIEKKQIDKRQAWENYAETLFNINRRLADYAYATAQSWEELCRVHAKYVNDYRSQEHWAHREREDGKRTPKEVLGWSQGRPCTPAQLDDAFTLRFLRRLDRYGNVQLHHWKLYAEAGLPHTQTSIWIKDNIMTIAAAQTPLAEYEVHYDTKQRHLLDVGEVRLFQTPFTSHQGPLWDWEALAEVSWHPARKLDQLTPRRRRRTVAGSPLWDATILAATLKQHEDQAERPHSRLLRPLEAHQE